MMLTFLLALCALRRVNALNDLVVPDVFALSEPSMFYWANVQGLIQYLIVHQTADLTADPELTVDGDIASLAPTDPALSLISSPGCFLNSPGEAICDAKSNYGNASWGGSLAVDPDGSPLPPGNGFFFELCWVEGIVQDNTNCTSSFSKLFSLRETLSSSQSLSTSSSSAAISSTTSSAPTQTVASQSSPTTTPFQPLPEPDYGLSTGPEVGIVVGGLVAITLAIVIIIMLCKRRKGKISSQEGPGIEITSHFSETEVVPVNTQTEQQGAVPLLTVPSQQNQKHPESMSSKKKGKQPEVIASGSEKQEVAVIPNDTKGASLSDEAKIAMLESEAQRLEAARNAELGKAQDLEEQRAVVQRELRQVKAKSAMSYGGYRYA